MQAIQMATINTAEHFGVSRQVGMIAPGRFADVLILEDLTELKIDLIIAKGKIAVQNNQVIVDIPSFPYPDWVLHSVNIGKSLTANDFALKPPKENLTQVKANIIGVIENQAPTKHLRLTMPVVNGEIHPDIKRDIAKIAVVERHKGTGNVQVGLVHGFGFDKKCAIASTVAHDCHQLVVVGTDEAQMALAVNELAHMGGGQVVVLDGRIIGKVELPIAGLMSNEKAQIVAEKAKSVLDGFRVCGCPLNNPNMQLSLLALVVIPEIRLSDLGLVDVTQFKFIPVLES